MDTTINQRLWKTNRNATDTIYHIVSAAQKRPTNWIAALRSSSFKSSLVEFLVPAWSNSDYASLFEGKNLFDNCGNICYQFMSILDKVVITEENYLLLLMKRQIAVFFFHVSSLENQSNVIIRTADTDYLITGPSYRKKLDPSLKIWFEVGV